LKIVLSLLIFFSINIRMDTPPSYKYGPLIAQTKLSQKKMSLEPIIVPLPTDREVWSYPSYRHSAVNYNNDRYDISDQYVEVPNLDTYVDFDPRMKTYTDFTLDNIDPTCIQNQNTNPGATILNTDDTQPLIESTNNGANVPVDITGGQASYYNPDNDMNSASYNPAVDQYGNPRQFNMPAGAYGTNPPVVSQSITATSTGNPAGWNKQGLQKQGIKQKPNSIQRFRQKFNPSITEPTSASVPYQNSYPYFNGGDNPSNYLSVPAQFPEQSLFPAPYPTPYYPDSSYFKPDPPAQAPPFYFTPTGTMSSQTSSSSTSLPAGSTPISSVTSTLPMGSTPIAQVTGLGSTFNPYNPGNSLPPQDLLIPKTLDSVYGVGAVTNEERIKYLQTIEPNIYSYSDIIQPINANLGISYTPDIPPLFRDQVATPYGTYPLFHRMDPEYIRDEGLSKARMNEMPRRTAWSAKYQGFDAQPGTTNFEDIYDPKFNSYGSAYSSYGDVNSGNVQYYYSDVDSYRSPNFSLRSKVDFIDYLDPMGKVIPEYNRQIGYADIKDSVHNQWDSDQTYFREDLMERLMRKTNAQSWQLRAAPLRKNANTSSFTSNY
jgi:hypothetical protein